MADRGPGFEPLAAFMTCGSSGRYWRFDDPRWTPPAPDQWLLHLIDWWPSIGQIEMEGPRVGSSKPRSWHELDLYFGGLIARELTDTS